MHEERVVVFSGGGTGGHLYPALALADALVARRPDVRPFFVGAERGLEATVLPGEGVEHLLLPVRGIARGQGLANWRFAPALLRSLWRVDRLFRRRRPELVVVTGGYAGAPAGIVAGLRGVPLALQEQNAVPGLATRLLSRWARQIHVAFPEVVEHLPRRAAARVSHAGNPIRPPVEIHRAEARRHFGLDPGATVLLVVGGSQGSRALNELVTEAVLAVEEGTTARPAGLQILWATGPDKLDAVRASLGSDVPAWVRPVGYIHAMAEALAAADLAVSRAGAMATSELLAWGVPMILVPLPTAAADHQTHNARTLEEAGAAIHLPEAGLVGSALWTAVTEMVADPAGLEERRKAARARGRPESAERIAADLSALLPDAAGARGGGGQEGGGGRGAGNGGGER